MLRAWDPRPDPRTTAESHIASHLRKQPPYRSPPKALISCTARGADRPAPRQKEEAMATSFVVNGKPASTDAPAATPVLWVLREDLKLTGTKFGCGTGLCGACTVHI